MIPKKCDQCRNGTGNAAAGKWDCSCAKYKYGEMVTSSITSHRVSRNVTKEDRGQRSRSRERRSIFTDTEDNRQSTSQKKSVYSNRKTNTPRSRITNYVDPLPIKSNQ